MVSGRYLTSLRQDRKKVKELTLTEAADLSPHRGGLQQTLYEYLDEDHYYVPFTDSDIYCDTEEPPSQDFVREVLDCIFRNLYTLVGAQSPENADFKMATRHGLVEDKGVYKLSFRCYLFGFRIKLKDMRDLIVSKGLDQNGLGAFDKAPYNKTQLLGCVGFAKSQTDGRMLLPTLEACAEPGILEGFMVQNLTGKEPILVNDDESTERQVAVSEAVEDDVLNMDGPRFCPPWKLLEKCVMSLSIERRCEKGTYHEWTRIGWAIAGCARIAKRSSDGLDLWLRFCKQSSVYYENSCTAISVFSRASNHGRRLGWNSLMAALEEDAPGVHREIHNQLIEANETEITNEDELKILKKFLYTSFHHKPNHVGRISVKSYGEASYIIVNTTEDRPYCPIFEGEHEPVLHPYVVIGLKNARNKCRHHDCKDKTDIVIELDSYPSALKTIVDRLLRRVVTPGEAISKFIKQRKDIDFPSMRTDEMCQLGPPQKLPFGNRYALPHNTYCYICKCEHDKPENCIIIDQAARQLMLGCRLNPYEFHPPGGLELPNQVSNVLVQNNVYNTINVTQTDSSAALLDSDFSGDGLPNFAGEPEKFERFIRSISGGHNDIAWFVHSLWGHEFRYFDDKWHCFEQHIWNSVKKTPLLRSRLSTILCDHYKVAQRFYRDNSFLPKSKVKIESLKKIILNLKSAQFKDSVMKEIIEVFLVENREWAKHVNTADLLPFSNGVLDLRSYEFRDGLPEDRMTLSTRTDYVPYDKHHPVIRKIKMFVRSVQPDKLARAYLMKTAALCTTRDTFNQCFSVLTGSGANGKSLFTDLLARTLGDFAITARVEILTMTAGSPHSAQSGLDNLEHKRLVLFDEPPKQSVLQAEIIKRFAGGTDKISTRGLHQAEREFVPVFKPILACNSIPRVSEDSHAVWRRLVVIDFPVRFVDQPNPDDPFSQQADHALAHAIQDWSPFFAGYLVKWLRKLRIDGLRPPSAVTAITEEYREDNDPYSEYRAATLEQCSREVWLQWSDLLNHFRQWHDRRFPTRTLKEKGKDISAIKTYFTDKLGGFTQTSRNIEKDDGQKEKVNIYGFLGWRFRSVFLDDVSSNQSLSNSRD